MHDRGDRCPRIKRPGTAWLASILVAIAASSVSIGHCDEPPAGRKIEVDLRTGQFVHALPFDEVFTIKAKVGKLVTGVTVDYRRKPSTDWSPVGPPPLDGWSRSGWYAPTDEDIVEVQIDPLEAKSHYQFRFTIRWKPDDTERQTFVKKATASVDIALRKLGESGTMSPQEVEDLHTRLLHAARAEGEKLVVPPGTTSVLDESQNGTSTLSHEIARLQEAQNRKFDAARSFDSRMSDAATKIGALFVMEQLQSLVAAIEQKREKETKELAQELDQMLNIWGERSGQTPEEYAFGRLPHFPSIWETGKTGGLESRIEEVHGANMKLVGLTNMILRHEDLQKLLELDEDRAKVLRTAAVECADSLSGTLLTLGSFDRAIEYRSAVISEFVKMMGDDYVHVVAIEGSTYADLETEHSWYVSADLGILVAPDISEAYPYFGTNIYLRQVNKGGRFANLDCGLCFSRRFSIMLGITADQVKKEGQREGLLGDLGLLAGCGLRVTRSIRVSAGTLMFRELDPNPLIEQSSFSGTYFVSLSFDWDVRSSFQGFGRKIGLIQ